MSKTYLKIKIISLAAEAAIIRAEERKWPRERDISKELRSEPEHRARWETRTGLRDHRTGIVRREARASLLAYGFLRGRAYRQIEANCHEIADTHRITEIICKFDNRQGSDARHSTYLQVRDWLRAEALSQVA
jgi:hypothetical protein